MENVISLTICDAVYVANFHVASVELEQGWAIPFTDPPLGIGYLPLTTELSNYFITSLWLIIFPTEREVMISVFFLTKGVHGRIYANH